MNQPAAEGETFHPLRLLLALVVSVLVWWAGALLPFGAGVDPSGARAALFVTALTVGCWLTAALPLGPASLLPLVLLPMLGVRSAREVGQGYADPVLWLFGGGFVLAQAIEKWGLHRRLSLWVLQLVGPYPRRLVYGFMLVSTTLSLFINNTSTALMLLPIGWALVARATGSGAMPQHEARDFAAAVMLAIAYGASFGGVGTPIGTAPNALYLANYRLLVEQGAPPMSFFDWVAALLPFSYLLALVGAFLLTRVAFRVPKTRLPDAHLMAQEAAALGPMSRPERRTAGLFLVAALLWMTRGDVRLGEGMVVRGWASRLLPGRSEGYIGDGTVAVLIAVLAFMVPAGTGDGRRLMDWTAAKKLPFDILFLLGGGIALAESFEPTGLSGAIGNLLAPLVGELHPMLLLLVLVSVITLLSEVASNTAIAALFLPLMMAAARKAGIDPRVLMLPTVVAASCGFMLPIATPPNTLAFATGHVTFRQMARAGALVDVAAVVLMVLVLWFWSLPMLGVDMHARPR